MMMSVNPYFFFGHGNTHGQYMMAVLFEDRIKPEIKKMIEDKIPPPVSHQVLWHEYGFISYGFDDNSFPVNYVGISAKYFLNTKYNGVFGKYVEVILSTLDIAQKAETHQMNAGTYYNLFEEALGVPNEMDLYENSQIEGPSGKYGDYIKSVYQGLMANYLNP